MTRTKKSLLLSILVMLSLCISRNKLIVFGDSNDKVETNLVRLMGSNYNYVYKKRIVKLPANFNLINYEKVIYEDFNLEKFNGDDEKRLQKIVGLLSNMEYNELQSNPVILAKKNIGNCQAVAILFKFECDKNNLECSIERTSDHMYNLVTIGNKKYRIDIANKIIKEEI